MHDDRYAWFEHRDGQLKASQKVPEKSLKLGRVAELSTRSGVFLLRP
jgi:hypothetical protein